MTVKERRAREKQELRQEILDAARDLFASEGYENVSMRKIAEKIDYSPTTIYLYFADKYDLCHEICRDTFGMLVKEFQNIITTTNDPIEQIRGLGRAYIEFGVSHPNHYKVTFMGFGHQQHMDMKKFDFHGSIGETCFMGLRRVVQECVRQGKFRAVDVDATSQGLWAIVHGITSLLIVHPHFPWVDKNRLVDQVIEVMTEGLKA